MKKSDKKKDIVITKSSNATKQSKIDECKKTDAESDRTQTDEESEKNVENDYYEIEKILSHKKKSKNRGKFKHELNVKWKGYEETSWIDEDILRQDVEDEVNKYFNGLKKKNKKDNKKNKRSTKTVRKKCILSHQNSNDFRKTENPWEVSKVKCRGNCKKDFAEKLVCNAKNPVWVCEGNKNECYCAVLYCNMCYIEKFFGDDNRNCRSSRRNK